jgi:rubrerythrin
MELSNFQEVITFAIRKEADAATLYETYANKVTSRGIKKMFEELMKQELGHKKMLQGITEQKVGDYKLTDIPDLKISDYSQEQAFKPDMNFQEALLLAIKREENALNLYNNLVKSTNSSQLQKLFKTLAQEEAKHKLRLETEYDEHVYKWD